MCLHPHTHTHAQTNGHTHTHTDTDTGTWGAPRSYGGHVHTHTHTRTCMHAQTDTHTQNLQTFIGVNWTGRLVLLPEVLVTNSVAEYSELESVNGSSRPSRHLHRERLDEYRQVTLDCSELCLETEREREGERGREKGGREKGEGERERVGR